MAEIRNAFAVKKKKKKESAFVTKQSAYATIIHFAIWRTFAKSTEFSIIFEFATTSELVCNSECIFHKKLR